MTQNGVIDWPSISNRIRSILVKHGLGRDCSAEVSSDDSDFSSDFNEKSPNQSKAIQKRRYVFVNKWTEDHEKVLYGVRFFHYSNNDDIFLLATAGANRLTVYALSNAGILSPLFSFIDPSSEEEYYTCEWTVCLETNTPLAMVAGLNGVIRIVNVYTCKECRNMQGHGGSINHLKTHPTELDIILSASKDYSCRLWNIVTGVCIAKFSGAEGHMDQVISVDFHHSGKRFASCGLDHFIRIWNLDKEEIANGIESSRKYDPIKSVRFKTYCEHFPIFKTREIHTDYVDCVQWYDDYLFTKSCENFIIAWKPGGLFQDSNYDLHTKTVSILKKFHLNKCNMWFVRFILDLDTNLLCVGTSIGRVYVWNLNSVSASIKALKPIILQSSKSTSLIRQIDLINNGQFMVAVADDSSLLLWKTQN